MESFKKILSPKESSEKYEVESEYASEDLIANKKEIKKSFLAYEENKHKTHAKQFVESKIMNNFLLDLLKQSILESDGTSESVIEHFVRKTKEEKLSERFLSDAQINYASNKIEKDLTKIESEIKVASLSVELLSKPSPTSMSSTHHRERKKGKGI